MNGGFFSTVLIAAATSGATGRLLLAGTADKLDLAGTTDVLLLAS